MMKLWMIQKETIMLYYIQSISTDALRPWTLGIRQPVVDVLVHKAA